MSIPLKNEIFEALASRHGYDIQHKFDKARVAVCGLGGLGSNVAIALARAGVGTLHIIDFDNVDITNINRQQYFIRQIGQPKTAALTETLQEIAPYCSILPENVRLDSSSIPTVLSDDNIIVEAFDNAEQKAMLVNTVLEQMPDKYLVAASGMAGLSDANDIQTRKITDRLYICGDGVSDISDGAGLFGSRVLVCAAHEAHAVIQIISNIL